MSHVVKRKDLGKSISYAGNSKAIEMVTYSDGVEATGVSPLPNSSPVIKSSEVETKEAKS